MGEGSDPEVERLPWRQCMMYLEEALYCGHFAVDCRSPPGEAIGYCKVGNQERERSANHIEWEWLFAGRIPCSLELFYKVDFGAYFG